MKSLTKSLWEGLIQGLDLLSTDGTCFLTSVETTAAHSYDFSLLLRNALFLCTKNAQRLMLQLPDDEFKQRFIQLIGCTPRVHNSDCINALQVNNNFEQSEYLQSRTYLILLPFYFKSD